MFQEKIMLLDDLGEEIEPVNNCGKLPDGILTV